MKRFTKAAVHEVSCIPFARTDLKCKRARVKPSINIQRLHCVTGVCEDLTKAASTAASTTLPSQLLFALSIAAYAAVNTLRVLSR